MKIKVLAITFRPECVTGWSSSNKLIGQYVEKMKEISFGQIEYDVVHHFTVQRFPKLDATNQYNCDRYIKTVRRIKQPIKNLANELAIAQYTALGLPLYAIDSGKYDEIWLFGGPYFGFYESRMVGRNAEWCNSPPLKLDCRTFVVMGFSYERTVTEMLHNLGHRVESYLERSEFAKEYKLWKLIHGTVHIEPGGEDYSQDEVTWLKALPLLWLREAVTPEYPKTLKPTLMDYIVRLLKLFFPPWR